MSARAFLSRLNIFSVLFALIPACTATFILLTFGHEFRLAPEFNFRDFALLTLPCVLPVTCVFLSNTLWFRSLPTLVRLFSHVTWAVICSFCVARIWSPVRCLVRRFTMLPYTDDGSFNDDVVAPFSHCAWKLPWSDAQLLITYQLRTMQIVSKASLPIDKQVRLQQCLSNDSTAVLQVWHKSGAAAANAFVDERTRIYCEIITKPEPVSTYMSWLGRPIAPYLPVVSGWIDARPHIACGFLVVTGFWTLSLALACFGPLAAVSHVHLNTTTKLVHRTGDLETDMHFALTDISHLASNVLVGQRLILAETEAEHLLLAGPQLTLARRLLAVENTVAGIVP